jgi:hypothetical protein
MKFEFSGHSFKKSSNIKFHDNPSSVSRVVPCWRTDVRTDMTKQNCEKRLKTVFWSHEQQVKHYSCIFWASCFLTLTGRNTKYFELTGSKDSRHLTCSSFLRDYSCDQLLSFQIRVSEPATYYTDLPVTFILQCILTKYNQCSTYVLLSAFTPRQISPAFNGVSVLSSDIHVFAQLNSITSTEQKLTTTITTTTTSKFCFYIRTTHAVYMRRSLK